MSYAWWSLFLAARLIFLPPGPVRLQRPAQVYNLAISPDSRLLAAGWTDGYVRVWNLRTGRLLHRLGKHLGNVDALAFAPNGKILASAAGHIHFWDVSTGQEVRRLRQAGDVRLLAFSPDGKVLASGGGISSGDRVLLWDLAKGRLWHTLGFEEMATRSLAFSPDGRTLATGGMKGKMVRLWEMATGKERGRFPGSSGGGNCAAFLPDGKHLVVTADVRGGNVAGAFQVWDLSTGKVVRRFGEVPFGVSEMTVGADGRTLLTDSWDQVARLWDVTTGKEIRRLKAKDQPISAFAQPVALSADGRTLVAADTERGIIFLWDPATGKELHDLRQRRAGIFVGTAARSRKVRARRENGLSPAPRLRREQAAALWAELAGGDARQAYRAIWALAGSPQQAVPLLRAKLRPAACPGGPRRVARLIADLDNARYAVRRKASAELRELGEVAEGLLRQALHHPRSLEVRWRVGLLLKRLDKAPEPCERLRERRAVEALEHLGTPEAKRVLQRLARGMTRAWLTEEAKATLKRLAHRTTARR
jgi:WD40 repeat protein